eukprot:gene9117-11195_t
MPLKARSHDERGHTPESLGDDDLRLPIVGAPRASVPTSRPHRLPAVIGSIGSCHGLGRSDRALPTVSLENFSPGRKKCAALSALSPPSPPMTNPASLLSGPAHPPPSEVTADQTPAIVRLIGLAVGLALFLLTFVVAPPDGMTVPAWRVCGLALWMAVWWITEAVPLPVTALLPLVVLPLANLM